MKRFLKILPFILLTSFVSSDKTKVTILNRSEVVIKGESNVNCFECLYDTKLIQNEITVTHIKRESKLVLDGAIIKIKSKGFDCGHKMITSDLKKVLKSEVYPDIEISIKEIVSQNNKLLAKTNIKITGIEKNYILPVNFDSSSNNVKGDLTININDFDLKSPKKVLGLIKLKETITIHFNLFLEY